MHESFYSDSYRGSFTQTLDSCYHFADRCTDRDNCVLATVDQELLARRVALTDSHLARRVAIQYWNHLTLDEIGLVKDLLGE